VPALVIRRFSNAEKAMEYYQAAVQNLQEFLKPEEGKYIKQKSMAGYPEFFEENYHWGAEVLSAKWLEPARPEDDWEQTSLSENVENLFFF